MSFISGFGEMGLLGGEHQASLHLEGILGRALLMICARRSLGR